MAEETRVAVTDLSLWSRIALYVQREVGRLLGPLWIPALVSIMRLKFRWKIKNQRELRRAFCEAVRSDQRPILLCANHLTMVDSFLIAWAIAPTWWYVLNFSKLAWNLPERRNFASNRINHFLIYLMKCLPVVRGGDRADISEVLKRVVFLLARNEVVLIFPEGGRSRTGRVEIESAAYGVGRIVNAVPGCRVLCVYLRGEHQEKYSDYPIHGEEFDLQLSWLEPKTEKKGLRASVEVSQQILGRIAEMEREYFDARQ